MRVPPSRRALACAALALLATASPAGAQRTPSVPPPARAFGPDHTAIGMFTGEGITPAGLACDLPAEATTPLTCAGFLASVLDGTRLEATVRVPRTRGLHPLVVGVHGWGGSQASMAAWDERLTSEGYTFLRYSARGFGKSWGQTHLADVHVEADDLRSAISRMVDDDRLAVDPARVAVFGASYGGAHAWLAALEPTFRTPRNRTVVIRTIAPVATWSDLLAALAPNGAPDFAHDPAGAQKLSWSEALFAGGLRRDPARPYPSYPDFFLRWNLAASTNETPYRLNPLAIGMVDGMQGYRSIYWQESLWRRVRQRAERGLPQLPVFAAQGFTDDLFPAHEALRMVDALRSVAPGYPVALYLGDLGHPGAANRPAEVEHVTNLFVRWLAYFLKGVGAPPAFDVQAAVTRPGDAPFDPADVVRVPTFDALATRVATVRVGGAQALTFQPANTAGFRWDPLVVAGCARLEPCPAPPDADLVPGDLATFTVPHARLAAAPRLFVAGEPVVSLRASTNAHRVHLHVRLYDLGPHGEKVLVSRGTFTADTGSPLEPLGELRVRIRASANLWELGPDHQLHVELSHVDSPYLRPSAVPSATRIDEVELALPVRDGAEAHASAATPR